MRRRLHEQAILSRAELDESERAAVNARAQTRETRQRLAETDSALAETLAAIELAREAAATSCCRHDGDDNRLEGRHGPHRRRG